MKCSIGAGLAVVIAVCAPATPTSAEEPAAERGNVVGTVEDAHGDPVAGATVEVLDDAGNTVGSGRTTSAGGYQIACVRPGDYKLRLDPAGAAYQGQTVAAPVDHFSAYALAY